MAAMMNSRGVRSEFGTLVEEAFGFPARLVAPGRRGFWWVKWVVSVEVDPAPWWRQPPFPLT
jgi:DMSO/TMAO reductase YedYZ molybdopterin-dependent catalytic subunit